MHGLVLAAGAGSRFGGRKLHVLYRGRPLLAHALAPVEAACASGLLDGGHVVIAAHDDDALTLAREAGLRAITNGAPHLGLSRSLRLGLESLQEDDRIAAAMVFLGDQPQVRIEVVEQLIQAWHRGGSSMMRPRYAAQSAVPGHPVLLSRAIWQCASPLEGDTGFGALPASSLDMVLVDVPGDNPDVDTPADLQGLKECGVAE